MKISHLKYRTNSLETDEIPLFLKENTKDNLPKPNEKCKSGY